jgi:hypothetical protein
MEILTPKGVRETAPAEPSYQDFPDASAAAPAKVGAAEGSMPAPPDDVDLGEDIDLEEDEDFLVD